MVAIPCPADFPHVVMNHHLNDRLFNRVLYDEHSSTCSTCSSDDEYDDYLVNLPWYI